MGSEDPALQLPQPIDGFVGNWRAMSVDGRTPERKLDPLDGRSVNR
ncbi:Uncharacterised protein [Mycobacteroides abscessus subsp. abscessus]|nr:Uncharacterised protein [Mycobacteroides abscessus subsp. abscessus]